MRSTSISVGAAPVRKCIMRGTCVRRAVIVRAADDKKLDFTTPTKASNTGYIEKDTAGQSNMYPIMQKPTGFTSDKPNSSNTSNAADATAAVAAAGAGFALIAGLLATTYKGPSSEVVTDYDLKYGAVSAYAAEFSSDLALLAAPAL
ncbi:MAG: hypothetical protein WDW36_007196 [Sanguina aurantia]